LLQGIQGHLHELKYVNLRKDLLGYLTNLKQVN
jgi:hypothetical protein